VILKSLFCENHGKPRRSAKPMVDAGAVFHLELAGAFDGDRKIGFIEAKPDATDTTGRTA
jgi:hypothetical protein